MAGKSVSTVQFGEAVKKFRDAGIHPQWMIPVAPVGAALGPNSVISDKVLGKAPGRFHERSGQWTGLGGRVIVSGNSRADFEEMSNWPTGSVGLLGRAYPGIDSDAMSEDARRFVEDVIYDAFGKVCYAERIRGSGPRRLYAFKCRNPKDEKSWVRTRHITYKLKGDDTEHKLDVIGYGGQYLITGKHPSGDFYQWHKEWALDDAEIVKSLYEIDNADMSQFIETFENAVKREGGEIVRASGGRGGSGDDVDLRKLDPSMPVDVIFDGLERIENNEATFLHRDDFVSVLAAVRAALGKESFNRESEQRVREWATVDPTWCDDAYFDKVWRSLDKVRTDRDALDRIFRRNGVRSHVGSRFDDGKDFSPDIEKSKERKKEGKEKVLADVASRYIFGDVNTRDKAGASVRMRDSWAAVEEWGGLDWWKFESSRSDSSLLGQLHHIDGYTPTKEGFFNFARDMKRLHPEAWYAGETRHPNFDRGEMTESVEPDGYVKREVNMRFLSPAIKHARKQDPNPRRSQEDVQHILGFVDRLFGKMAKYELDTLAYMAQTGERPGSMLFLVGDHGVGKSIYMNIMMAMFDGIGPGQSGQIDGTKLMSEGSRRFALANVEGCRILSIKELPEGIRARAMAEITSSIKQMVDPGPEGDWIMIEQKGLDAKPVRNFARVIISSNYRDAIHVEDQDRRIFYVRACITQEEKPNEDYYQRLVDIHQTPERLAAFYRYLRQREIGEYSPYKAPPVSSEKAEQIVMNIDEPAERHIRAAMELLKQSDRDVFDSDELCEIMTAMSHNEYTNSKGDIDDRKTYKVKGELPDPAFARALKFLVKHTVKLKPLRSNKERHAQIYVMRKHEGLAAEMDTWGRDKILDYVDDEYARGLIDHEWVMYQGPARVKP